MTELFLKIVNMSISASWLVLAVLVLRLMLKKAPKWANVLLWGIVAVRLICPFSIESALSLIPSAETIPMNIEMDATPAIDSGINVVDSVINPVISASFTPHPEASANPLQVWIPLASLLWICGMAALLLYTAVSYWRLHRKVDTAVLYRDNIFQSENVSSPFVLDILEPKIYLPFQLDGRNLDYVIAHEQAHIRRMDYLWKPLGFLLLTIHWFNPLMWLAYVLLCRDIELACDERVIKGLDHEQRADYMQALVACSVNRRTITACPLAFGEVGVKERVKSVMNYKKPAFWIIVLAVIACVIATVCFLTDPKQEKFSLKIVVPAGSQDMFVYTEEEISATGDKIILSSGSGLSDTEVWLKGVDEEYDAAGNAAEYLTPGMPVEWEAEPGEWYKVGINMQNDTDEDIVVYVDVENVEVRISEQQAQGETNGDQTLLEAMGTFIFEGVEYTWPMSYDVVVEQGWEVTDFLYEILADEDAYTGYLGLENERYPGVQMNIYLGGDDVFGSVEELEQAFEDNGIWGLSIDVTEAAGAYPELSFQGVTFGSSLDDIKNAFGTNYSPSYQEGYATYHYSVTHYLYHSSSLYFKVADDAVVTIYANYDSVYPTGRSK